VIWWVCRRGKLYEWEPTQCQVMASYVTYCVVYLVSMVGAIMMIQIGARCGSDASADKNISCEDDNYLCGWLTVMGFCQLTLLQPCLSSCFCCIYTFVLIWAGVGAAHLHTVSGASCGFGWLS
jgi:hypothetical protein